MLNEISRDKEGSTWYQKMDSNYPEQGQGNQIYISISTTRNNIPFVIGLIVIEKRGRVRKAFAAVRWFYYECSSFRRCAPPSSGK